MLLLFNKVKIRFRTSKKRTKKIFNFKIKIVEMKSKITQIKNLMYEFYNWLIKVKEELAKRNKGQKN